ncbi:crotonyl-CoA carboxylase/reductase [Nocardia nova]|uniref:crotonyl-CoA carboxylase/reductase n=1 Tax=Nocardia nova TaxID=37330 RepID=UPI001C4669E2|nr:crotonyl-CoA carboxylase/reductase [Nocardia nova]MBV7708169.1 crotonyl-CoA carboxylase/reductase [Nocardia nova]
MSNTVEAGVSMRTDEVFEVGKLPELGVVPRKMYASVIRPDRYGDPISAFQTELIDVPEIPAGFVLVAVMAAGINYNNAWAAKGQPLDVIRARMRGGEKEEFHVGGSEGSGIVWAVGDGVHSVKVGDPVLMTGARWDETATDIRNGRDPMMSDSQKTWGYELNYGSFAQFALVAELQCIPKPDTLSWEESACFLLTAATAYRQLTHWAPNRVEPGSVVLVWGASGGLGSMACQIVNMFGGRAIGVVSGKEKADFCLANGAVGVIDRSEFRHWGQLPVPDTEEMSLWSSEVRRFGREIWQILGERRSPDIVFEHPGESTLPTSIYICDTAGMVVLCGATSGFVATLDLRHLWMRQKRLQGSHFANLSECRAVVELAGTGRLDPCLGKVYKFEEIGRAHQDMVEGRQAFGNSAARVGSA